MSKIKQIIAALTLVFSCGLVFAPVMATADFQGDACSGVNELSNTTDTTPASSACTDTSSSVTSIVSTAISILSLLVGIVTVIMVIVAGFRYVTSGGESGKVSAAKNALIYAVIGMLVVAFSQFLIHFVFNTTNSAVNGTSGSPVTPPATCVAGKPC